MTGMQWFSWLLCVVTLLPGSLAGKCWRDTDCSGPRDSAFPGPWEENIFAPASRTVRPKKTLLPWGCKSSVDYGQSQMAILNGNGSMLVFDFGLEVGGIVSLNYTATNSGVLGLAFTEAKDWIGEYSDSSNGAFEGADGAVYATFTEAGTGTYTMPDERLRGGFRYLTVFLMTNYNTEVWIQDISLELPIQPTWSNLRAYQGYFHSNDEQLNRIWYSGAYTLQTNAVPVHTGRQVPMVTSGWANNCTLGPGDTIIVDGAKRDRAVWPGDMGVAVPSTFVSTGDLESVKNALQVMYNTQDESTGSFDESGPPLSQKGSDTYHMWTMIGTYNYMLFTNDTDFLTRNWGGYQAAMDYIYNKVDDTSGLLNVTGTRDWARYAQGYNNSEAQMILYHTLRTGAHLATWAGAIALTNTWHSRADDLADAVMQHNWDDAYGAFKDNATATTLHPQDTNSLALLYRITDLDTAERISSALPDNWNAIGAVAPELPGNISPFISSFEIQGHFAIRQTARALDLLRRSWGWYLTNPNGTGSTVIEGYLEDGSFGYRSERGYSGDASYVSHSHGWSSGPTSALTSYVLGLSITSPLGVTWKLAPQFGDLCSVEGGFVTGLGKFWARWRRGREGYTVSFSVPKGTMGNVTLPFVEEGEKPDITIDGVDVYRGLHYTDDTATVGVSGGGAHKVVVR